jgi:GNAT superfamily N-acetyltransferase
MAKVLEKKPDITIREMSVDDISLGMKLKSIAGWNQQEQDWKMFLEAGGANFVANWNGKDVGTVISIPYEDHFTWIGMVLVDPVARQQGIGTALLNKIITYARKRGPVRLDATADGYELYKKLGFRKEYELIRMTASPDRTTQKGKQLSDEVRNSDLGSLAAYDSPVFGANRDYILASLHSRNPEYARCIRGVNSLNGYCLGRSGSKYEQIGPVVADSFDRASDLLLEVLEKCTKRDIVIDAFADKPQWIKLLEELGFTAQRGFIRMCLGELEYPGITDNQFAMAGPEIG